MLKKLSTIPFSGTAEQEAQLNCVIEKYKGDKSRLMAVMQEAQGIYGYLPIEVQNKIAEGMEVPLEKVYGVATFYAQFSLSPKGNNHVAVCLGCKRRRLRILARYGILLGLHRYRRVEGQEPYQNFGILSIQPFACGRRRSV